MTVAQKLLEKLRSKGLTLRSSNGRDIEVSPKDLLTEADRKTLRNRKPELLQLIIAEKPAQLRKLPANGQTPSGPQRKPLISFRWGDEQIAARRYRRNQGQVFRGRFALDCETEVVKWPNIPQLTLVGVSDGKTHYLIHPDDIPSFVLAHRQNTIVCHNVSFDFWVIHKHLAKKKETKTRQAWTDSAQKGRFRDTMLLDMLLSIATGASAGEHIRQRDLGVVAEQYTGLQLDKHDPYRTRYGEIIGCDWRKVAPGFFRYAIKDPIATARAYGPMYKRALALVESMDVGEISGRFRLIPDALRRFGALTEHIQVGAAIALDAISRTGMCIDTQYLATTSKRYELEVSKTAQSLNRRYPGLFKLDEHGQFLLTQKSGVPSKSDKRLEECLIAAAKEIEASSGETDIVPLNDNGKMSKSVEMWEHLADRHTFLQLWRRHSKAAKLVQFLRQLNAEVMHPRYSVLKVTGRTSCSSPNIQQVPREDDFRELIVASPGHLLLAVDYKFIELVTLAAVCETRFGQSRLAEVIRDGVDPHCYTAAMLLGRDYGAFLQLKKRRPEEFKRWRQLAKPINFGVPGGMGPKSLTAYAKSNYGVDMSADEAQEFHRRLVERVYPELRLYLADSSIESLAKNLGIPTDELWARLDSRGQRSPAIAGSVRKIVEGTPYKADGTPYSERYVRRVWETLAQLNSNPAFAASLRRRSGSVDLAVQLFFTSVPTVTGRIRGGVTYTSERNTQFQGLAADGAKLALARLVLADYRVVGFVHDEILVELPDEGGYVSRAVVEGVLAHVRLGMEEVTCGVPVECEYTVASCWSKRAELIERGNKVIPWRP